MRFIIDDSCIKFEVMKKFLSKKIIFTGSLLTAVAVMAFQSTPIEKEVFIAEPVATNLWVDEQLASMTLREKIGQFFMVAAYSGKDEAHYREIDSLVVRDKVGGIIFFQGNKSNLQSSIKRFQSKAKIPLMIGMDAEWGVSMRLEDADRFPYNYTIGAADNVELTERIAEMMGQECRELGIHINFAPVADVNSNPNNPVIGFRAYGENPKDVAAHVEAAVKGMEKQSVLTSLKHFPGHGDTDVDSHLELPIVNNTYAQINAIDFFPFRSGIRAGASSVMIGHLNVPALDPSGTPSSLSALTIQKYLIGELGFKGLIISDALGMKAVADRYGKVDVVVKAFQAGCDILLFPESVGDAIDAIEKKVNSGEIPLEEINRRCAKVLMAKHKAIIAPKDFKKYTAEEIEWTKKALFEKAITVVKNENDLFPIRRFDQKIVHVTIGNEAPNLENSMDLVTPIRHVHFKDGESALKWKDSVQLFDMVITSLHATSVRAKNDYGMPSKWREWLNVLSPAKKNIVALFGNPLVLKENCDLSNIQTVVVGYENHELLQDRMGQFLMGTYESAGRLPFTVNATFGRGKGEKVKSAGRLKDSQPEELGVSRQKLQKIDDIVERSIAAGAFPGCQIVVAFEGSIVYRKSFGNHTYDTTTMPVQNTDIYDIASVTKIAASTLSMMYLESKGEVNLDNQLQDLIPELVEGTRYGPIRIKNMMAHQAGLVPWIPFYTKTLSGGQLKPEIYASKQSLDYNTQVGEDLWIKTDYTDQIYADILATTLNAPKYKYSDVGYYFLKKIIEKKSGKSLDKFVEDEFYKPMGLKYMCYNPLRYFNKSQITPTENDVIFRKQQIHGFVHDQGAAMMGGVGGHAGIFANASDLAQLMQLFLNKGSFGYENYIAPAVVERYTSCQFCPSNRRGAGFDKPTINRVGGPASSAVSLSSFGHSGFTGTLAWADPENKVNYVFLSNRVYTDAENWKIVKMNIRTEIQDVIYDALNTRKK